MDIEAPSVARSQYLRSNERGGFPIQADDTVTPIGVDLTLHAKCCFFGDLKLAIVQMFVAKDVGRPKPGS